MTRTVFHIGPLPDARTEDQSFAYFLFPGEADKPAILARSLSEALPRLRAFAPADKLACEPELRGEAAGLGIGQGEWNEAARASLGLIAVQLALPESFKDVESDATIHQFLRAAASFHDRMPWSWPAALRRLAVSVGGETGSRQVFVIGAEAQDSGLAILNQEMPRQLVADNALGELGLGAAYDGFGVVFRDVHSAYASAMRRAYGVSYVPEPFGLQRGSKLHVNGSELTAIVAILFAISDLDPPNKPSGAAFVNAGNFVAIAQAAVEIPGGR